MGLEAENRSLKWQQARRNGSRSSVNVLERRPTHRGIYQPR